jgi:hypothetical protein
MHFDLLTWSRHPTQSTHGDLPFALASQSVLSIPCLLKFLNLSSADLVIRGMVILQILRNDEKPMSRTSFKFRSYISPHCVSIVDVELDQRFRFGTTNIPQESHPVDIPTVQSDTENPKSVLIPCIVYF